MSYKTFKRLLGETSLERKCRFLFGSFLLILISGSFYFYAWRTTKLVDEQTATTARLLVSPVILEKHWQSQVTSADQQRELQRELQRDLQRDLKPPAADPDPVGPGLRGLTARVVEKMALELKPEEFRDYSWTLLKADLADPIARPTDAEGHLALEQIRSGKSEVIKRIREKQRHDYVYYSAVRASESCLACHRVHNQNPNLAVGDLIGMAKISIPLAKMQKAIDFNNAILLATALVTAFLAMLAAYSIVRYVIVKPVLHLKDVSDTIARGSLETRADIRTGDEFEELSHAFNRMLRHLVTVQEELQSVNSSLDAKVDELAQVNLRLYEMNNLKNDFLATMSHELRTPLNSILGFSDVLLSASTLSDKQQRYVRNIQTSGKNLLNLINDVLDLAKIESGKMELHPVEFSVSDMVERMVGSLQPLAERKSLELTWYADPRLALAYQDSGKLEQIVANLLSNAIKFTPDGGRVQVRALLGPVRASSPAETLQLEVEDTGIGIPLEEQERIFEKFRQGRFAPGERNMLTREYEGTGLGLSIIKELSKLLGGEILLQSEFGKGSRFTVIVPLRLTAEGNDSAAGSPPLERPTPIASLLKS